MTINADLIAKRVDRTDWPPGPWDREPDRVDFTHNGRPCLILRHAHLGHLCGYVAVLWGHPWYEAGSDDESLADPGVHGGITYGGRIEGAYLPGAAWWLGFDCAHAGDMMPGLPIGGHFDTYRSIEYVRRQVEHLADLADRIAESRL